MKILITIVIVAVLLGLGVALTIEAPVHSGLWLDLLPVASGAEG